MYPSRTPGRLAMAATLCFGASHLVAAQEERDHLEERVGVRVYGEVVDRRSSEPVIGSTVALAPLPSRTPRLGPHATDDAGRFAFEAISPGWYLVTVTAPDYVAASDSVEVPVGEDLQLVLALSTDSRSLDARVVAARASSAMRGHEARWRSGGGFVVTRKEIVASNAAHLTDLLDQMPGARVISTPPAGRTLLLRGGCRPDVWLNGARMRDAPPLDRVAPLRSVAAIEVYHGFDLPAEFGVNACGGVLVWTRTGPALSERTGAAPSGDLIRRAAVVVGLVVLSIFLIR